MKGLLVVSEEEKGDVCSEDESNNSKEDPSEYNVFERFFDCVFDHLRVLLANEVRGQNSGESPKAISYIRNWLELTDGDTVQVCPIDTETLDLVGERKTK